MLYEVITLGIQAAAKALSLDFIPVGLSGFTAGQRAAGIENTLAEVIADESVAGLPVRIEEVDNTTQLFIGTYRTIGEIAAREGRKELLDTMLDIAVAAQLKVGFGTTMVEMDPQRNNFV